MQTLNFEWVAENAPELVSKLPTNKIMAEMLLNNFLEGKLPENKTYREALIEIGKLYEGWKAENIVHPDQEADPAEQEAEEPENEEESEEAEPGELPAAAEFQAEETENPEIAMVMESVFQLQIGIDQIKLPDFPKNYDQSLYVEALLLKNGVKIHKGRVSIGAIYDKL
jgi:hypothetical protein